jgi:tripartite-type tricarboxylate transporter receptor subunit TctC
MRKSLSALERDVTFEQFLIRTLSQKLSPAEVRKVIAPPDVKDRSLKQSVERVGMTPAETSAYIKTDTAATAKLVREAGIKLER